MELKHFMREYTIMPSPCVASTIPVVIARLKSEMKKKYAISLQFA